MLNHHTLEVRAVIDSLQVFGNSNSLPISLVISLSQTLKGLHWDMIPGDNDDEVAARGILYLLIFQQLGQLLRWSWGYHVLLAPPEKFEEEDSHTNAQIEEGEYRDDPDEDSNDTRIEDGTPGNLNGDASYSFDSGEQTPLTHRPYTSSISSKASSQRQRDAGAPPELMPTPANGNIKPRSDERDQHITSFPSMQTPISMDEREPPSGFRGLLFRFNRFARQTRNKVAVSISKQSTSAFQTLPTPVQKTLAICYRAFMRFMHGLWEFMNPPLWAMLAAIVVASVPSLQRLFFAEGSFVANSVTRAVSQSGGVAVPLILVVLGANLAKNTLPNDPQHSVEDDKQDRNLLIAALISRMLLPIMIMGPILALTAKYVPVSILDDPIFVIVCFLLTGAPSALQLAQICQINGVYMGAMSKLLFQSYVVWYVLRLFPWRTWNALLMFNRILPSTLILVMCALETVEWAVL